MAQFGNTTTPTAGWFFYGLNVQNAAWSLFTMPTPGGRITSMSAYFDTNQNGAATCYLVIWNGNTGALIADVAVPNVPNGGHFAGGQAWHSATFAGNGVYIKGGTALALGFWTPQNNGLTASTISSGGSYSGTQAGSGPGTASGPSTGFGALGVYCDYAPCLLKVRRSGVWQEAPIRVRRAGVWQVPPVYVRRGGVWTQVQ